jgi:hypothetical protein
MSKKESNKLPTMGTIRLEPTPFSISFRWRDSEVKLTLKNGEDILKVGKLFSDMFSENGIEHTIETEGGLGESESFKENFIDSNQAKSNVDGAKSNVDNSTSGSWDDNKVHSEGDFMYNWIRKHSKK